MATMKILAQSYTLSSTYLSISDASNMYTDTSSSTYATIQNTRSSTNNTYYLYIHNFEFGDIPSDATVSSFSIKIKASESNLSTSSSYRMSLYNNTTSISNTTVSSSLSTTATVFTFPNGSLTWDTLSGYGNNFRIRVPLRRSSTSANSYAYVYGAEIEVTYTVPVYHSVTIQNSTSATVEASDTNPLEGEDVVISTDTISGLTFKDNGVDVTSQFIQATGGTVSSYPQSNFTTGFSSTSGNFYQSQNVTSTSWLEYAIGHSAESPYSTSNTSNTYVKPEGSTGWINYEFDFSMIPMSATITSVSVKVYGAREDSTIDSNHVARFQCYSGSTAKGSIQNFTSTSNGSVTVSDVGTWTASELHNAVLRFELGDYGGRMLGITWTVVYQASGYVYTISTITTDHIIVVTSGGSNATIYYKNNGSWVAATAVYKKINGSWVQQSDLTSVFENGVNYVKG